MSVLRASVIAMLLLAVATPAPAARKRKGPAIPIKPVGLLDWGGSLYLSGTFDGNERTQKNIVTTREQSIFEEGVNLNTRGYAYHPNLLDWNASLRMGLSQEWTMLNDANRKTNGTLLGYNLSGMFLREKPVSVRVFANQSQNLRDQSFAASTRGETQRMGAVASLKGKFPTSLLVETGTNTLTSERRNVDASVTHMNFKITDKRYSNWLTELEVDREDTSETSIFFSPGDTAGSTTDQSEVVDEVNLSNTWRFGPGKNKHSLTGSANLIDRKGFFTTKRTVADQRLELMHGKTFRSFYGAGFSSNETEAVTEEIRNGEIGIMKSFYKSLDVTLRATGRDRTIGEAENKVIGGFFDANYRKKTPIGRYTSSLGLGRTRETRTSESDQIFNQDQSVKLTGTTYVFLTSDKVVDSSIVVTNDDHTIQYLRGAAFDYEIRKTGQIVEIRRTGALSAITDPQTVLVSFITEGTGDLTFQTDRLRWQQRMALKHLPLSVYTSYTLRDETLIDGADPENLDVNRRFLMGTELDWKGLQVSVEREESESLLSPSTLAHRARVSYTHPLGRNSRLALGGHVSKLVYLQTAEFGIEEGQDTLDTVGANAAFTTKIGANTLLRLMSTYVTSEGRENSTEFSNGFSLKWQYGKLDLSVDGTYDVFEQEETTGTGYKLMFYLKREF